MYITYINNPSIYIHDTCTLLKNVPLDIKRIYDNFETMQIKTFSRRNKEKIVNHRPFHHFAQDAARLQ